MDEPTEPTPTDVVMAGHRGDPEPARRGVGARSAVTRRRSLGALVRTGSLDRSIAAAAARDPDRSVRRTLAELLPRTSMPQDAVSALVVGLLGDEDPVVVEAAAFAAGELSDPGGEPVELLVDLAGGHPDALVRESAVAALASLGVTQGRAAIVAACDDRASVRRRAVLGLAHFEGDDVDQLLERLADDRDLQVRQAAEDLVAIRRGEAAGAAAPRSEIEGQGANELDSPL